MNDNKIVEEIAIRLTLSIGNVIYENWQSKESLQPISDQVKNLPYVWKELSY